MKNSFRLTADRQQAACYIAFEEISKLFVHQDLRNRFLLDCRVEKAILSEGTVGKIREELKRKLNSYPDSFFSPLKEMRYELHLKDLFDGIEITFDTGLERVSALVSSSGKIGVSCVAY